MTQEAPNNRRSVNRHKVLKKGLAAFNDEFSAVPCVIRDMSETGARLIFDDTYLVPKRFMLFIELDGIKIECEQVRFEHGAIGVRFCGPPQQYRKRTQNIKMYDTYDEDGSTSLEGADTQNSQASSTRPSSRRKTTFGRLK